MIGFVSAISASLAIIILVVISSLIGYVQSIMPAKGLIKIDELTYRYVMEGKFIEDKLIEEDTQVYDLMILYDKMYFNAKQQSAEMAKRYKALYEDLSGIKIERTTFYHLSQSL